MKNPVVNGREHLLQGFSCVKNLIKGQDNLYNSLMFADILFIN